MTAASGLPELRQLASFHGVQRAYYGVDAHRRSASADSLLAALRALGCGVETPGDASAALRERRQQLARLPVETVTVAWDGNLLELPVRLPRNLASASWWCRLTLESREQRCLSFPGVDLPVSESTEAEGIDYLVKQIPLQVELPLGYHRLTLEIPGLPEAQTLVISAPTQAYRPQEPGKTHT